jgi:hypothetical protein
MDILEFNCSLCGRPIVLSARAPSPAPADRYKPVTLECSAEHGGACGWIGAVPLSEGDVVDNVAA